MMSPTVACPNCGEDVENFGTLNLMCHECGHVFTSRELEDNEYDYE